MRNEHRDPGRDVRPREVTPEQLAELLRGADTAWTTAEGVTRHWRRHDLVARAFDRYFERAGQDGADELSAHVSVTAEGPPVPVDEVLETVLRVAADRPRRRRRAELLSSVGAEVRADLLVIDGDTFWARTGNELLTNGGRRDYAAGGAEIIDRLLCPGYVPELFSLTVDGHTQVAGRLCLDVLARRRADVSEEEQWDPVGDPFDMVTGRDEFRLAVDSGIGVIVRASKFVDGELGEVTEWRELQLDRGLPAELFAPLTAPHGEGRLRPNYSLPGATRPADERWTADVPGFRRYERAVRIGHGHEQWAAAASAVLAWGVKTRSGFTVDTGSGPAGPVEVGEDYWLHASLGPFVVREPVRVVAVLEQATRCGFAYGTLEGHPVSGEEAFIVHRTPDGDVWLTLRSLTRPGRGVWRLAFPAVLIAQRWYRQRYMRALRSE